MALTKISRGLLDTGVSDSSDATAITIDSNENVGIGASSPSYPLTIHNAGDGIKFEISDLVDANYRIQVSGNDILTGPSTASDLIFQTGNTERMRINSSGNVGIGTTSPTYKLDVKHDNVGEATVAQFGGDNVNNIHDVRIYNSSQASGSLDEGVRLIFQLGNTNTGWIQAFKTADGTSAANRSGGLAFHTSNANSVTEKMRIDSSGEIHINKTSTINNGQLEILAQANHQAIVAKVQTDTKQNFLGYNSSGQVTSYISGNGNYYLPGTNASDRDLKENILSITESSLAKVKQLEPKTFNFKESEGFQTNKKTGFIAQEVAEIFGTENGVASGTDGKKDMGINSIGLIAHLTKAIQELSAKVEELESKINE